ncbi:hypothetical protein S7711_03982 [Stachybotrys chartarum IBT 7711]|uniref:Uncharacterized protein n=1 Tax=Stachybotrys chartarum (strain CBS 109288 / IBT 7711) TaxID=1280523 RepID=A0A084AR03_STACB|nr:hypothetical protein S7711_03982 [Stachybotrys chartarum IBT 7711]
MNRFRTRKKVKDEVTAPRPSQESDASSPFRMFGRKKSIDEESKPAIDLANALPTNDDFRTSLLMTGLSARFSMLREQDDPNSLLGKASDDSVLFTKRQSRMAEFGFAAGLGDIAEVESIRAPAYSRVESFQSSDDGASTTTSVMNRSKPLEGNSLFGGRQKIYKIPAGSKSGFPGRIVYDDDISQSAFQRWRQAQKERSSLDDDEPSDTVDSELPTDFSRRRETNSTTSSGPSASRNSTAATSIMSTSHTASAKDWQTAGSTNTPGTTPALERSITRTRRLYEQSLNQDLHEQQSSALSRIDTLTRQRNFGTRTPDLSPNVPSPTAAAFGERALDRRPIMAKSSAPNLRSFTPPTSGFPQMSPPEVGARFPPLEQKAAFGAVPPLSPPISETGDQPGLALQSGERSKSAAALFNRPLQQYDETKFAQRQRQMQQGRETPSGRPRGESNASVPTSRSTSRSSARGQVHEKQEPPQKEPTVQEESTGATFFDDDDDASVTEPIQSSALPQVTFARPDDQAHPALRNFSMERYHAVPPASREEQITERTIAVPENNMQQSSSPSPTIITPPIDSPTLGPTSGLSGMVHQHLRNASIASSFYGPEPSESQHEPLQNRGDTSCLDLSEADWDMAHGKVDAGNRPDSAGGAGSSSEMASSNNAGQSVEEELDDFARHLADGARRVREKLNSYVESDSNPATPIPTTPTEPNVKSLGPGLRSNALGILKSKSSRGSLVDRGRENREPFLPKASKAQGIGSATMPRSASKTSLEVADSMASTDDFERHDEVDDSFEQKENVHAGLKAFRQARRELQKMKELELQHRRQQPPQGPPPQPPYESHARPEAQPLSYEEDPHVARAPSQDRPPISYNRLPPRVDSRNGTRSRSGSRTASERDRSGSDTSNAGQNFSRPGRLRNGSSTIAEHEGLSIQPSNGVPRQGPMLRSPGLPGTDIKRSPIMPPHPYPSATSPNVRAPFADRLDGLNTQLPARHDPAQSSPAGPYSGPMHPHTRSTPVTPDAMTPEGLHLRMPRGRDVNDNAMGRPHGLYVPGHDYDRQPSPDFRGYSGSAASTPNLHAGHHGGHSAPPLPPINPRRKNGRSPHPGSSGEDSSRSPPPGRKSPAHRERSPAPLLMPENEAPDSYRQRLRKVPSEANVPNARIRRGMTDASRFPAQI